MGRIEDLLALEKAKRTALLSGDANQVLLLCRQEAELGRDVILEAPRPTVERFLREHQENERLMRSWITVLGEALMPEGRTNGGFVNRSA